MTKWMRMAMVGAISAAVALPAYAVPLADIGGLWCGSAVCRHGVPPENTRPPFCLRISQSGNDLNVTLNDDILFHGRMAENAPGLNKGMFSAISCDATVDPVHFHTLVGEFKVNGPGGTLRGYFTSDDNGNTGDFDMCEFNLQRVNDSLQDVPGCTSR